MMNIFSVISMCICSDCFNGDEDCYEGSGSCPFAREFDELRTFCSKAQELAETIHNNVTHEVITC